jgi:hypothetical protein
MDGQTTIATRDETVQAIWRKLLENLPWMSKAHATVEAAKTAGKLSVNLVDDLRNVVGAAYSGRGCL